MNPSSPVNTICGASTLDQQASLLGTVFLSVVNWFVTWFLSDWCGDSQRAVKGQPAGSPSPPSPMTTRSGMTLKHIQGVGSRSRRSATITGEEPSATRGKYQSFSSHLCSSSSQLPSSRSFTWRRKNSSRRTSMWRKRRTTTMRRTMRLRPRRKG